MEELILADSQKCLYMGCGTQLQDKLNLKQKLEHFEVAGYVAEEKLDGQWAQVHIIKGKVVKIISRNEKEKPFLLLQEYKFPEDFSATLMGEISYGSSNPKFQKKIALFYDYYRMYKGCANFVGEKWEYHYRRANLESLDFWNDKVGLVQKRDTRFCDFYQEMLSSGGEGIILKDKNSLYNEGTRPDNWVKVKKEVLVDMVVLGYDMREGEMSEITKAKGMQKCIKNIICGQYKDGKLVEEVHVGSMTDEARLYFTVKAQAGLLGDIVEIKGYEQFKSGAIKHPSLHVREDGKFLRDDLSEKDCVFGKIKII